MASRLNLYTFGPFRIDSGGIPLPGLGSGKMTALLIYLAFQAGQRLPRPMLGEMLWPDLAAESARFNLRHTLFHLRRKLGEAGDCLLSGKDWLCFSQDGASGMDAIEFIAETQTGSAVTPRNVDRLERISALYRDEFMSGFYLRDCPEFDDWLRMRREELHRRALGLFERLSEYHEQNGHFDRALGFTLRQIELEAWDEAAHRRIMRLHAANGQGRMALDHYERCCLMLEEELGARPSEETRLLAERIRNGKSGRRAMDAISQGEEWKSCAERRQVTALYAELAMNDAGQPLARLLSLKTRCNQILRSHSGHSVPTHGGGLLAYFGFPEAREDAASLAILAALAVTREASNGIEIHAGVHTGIIVTSGDLSMPDTSGQVALIAMQLRSLSGGVIVSEATLALVPGCFSTTAIGLHRFAHGTSEAFRVDGESGATRRPEP